MLCVFIEDQFQQQIFFGIDNMDKTQVQSSEKQKLDKKQAGDLGASKLISNQMRTSIKSRQAIGKFKSSSRQKSKSKSKSKPKQPQLKGKSYSNSYSDLKSHKQSQKQNTYKTSINFNQSPTCTGIAKQQINKYAQKVRKSNKKFISRSNSKQNLQMRLPWGVDQPRLNNYVLQTLVKMQKLRKGHQRSQDTFTTEKSQIKQSDIRLQLTPKKCLENSFTKIHAKLQDKIVKSPVYEQRTQKKQKSKPQQKSITITKSKHKSKSISTQQKHTQKPSKKLQLQSPTNAKYSSQQKQLQQQLQPDSQSKSKSKPANKKPINLPQMLSKSLLGQFQCLQKNNLYSLNFRIVNRKIIQIQLAILKKAQSLYINLNKGSLICQSINQSYQNITPKSSIILMTAITGFHKVEKYIYPQIQIIINQKNGNFGLQKKILIPYTWLFLLQIIPTVHLKQNKNNQISTSYTTNTATKTSKIKNKSIIQQIPYSKSLLQKMQKIFQNNSAKYKVRDNLWYLYGFVYGESNVFIRLMVNGNSNSSNGKNKCSLQCQSSTSTNTNQILEIIQYLLNI